MELKRSTQYNQLYVKTVKSQQSTSKADITLANISAADKIPGTIVYLQDEMKHVFWNGTQWKNIASTDSPESMTYTYIGHFTGSQLSTSCNTYWTDIKTACGIGSQYYISYPVTARVFYDSSSSYIYTSQSNTVVYQNGSIQAGKPAALNIWFTPQTSSGWQGTASIAMQFTIHK